ncbi:MAG TPA: hypothetical protein PLK63_17445 [Catalimonadaceae bacterium]|nr:hypothetical protein [Catalimonadaceae bacterium]
MKTSLRFHCTSSHFGAVPDYQWESGGRDKVDMHEWSKRKK